MSFLKQNLDFLIEEPYDLEFKPLGYLTIVVVAVLAFFVFVPKGDKKLSPASEITTDKAVEMRGVIGGDDRIIAHIPAGSALKSGGYPRQPRRRPRISAWRQIFSPG